MSTADTSPPQLTVSPVDGQAADTDLVFTFNEQIVAGSGTLTLRTLNGQAVFSAGVAGSPAITVAGSTLTLHLDQPLAHASHYWIELGSGAVQDLAGNASSTSYLSFTSGLSQVALNLTGTDKADTLAGSNLADTIAGGGGSDTIDGYDGDDVLNGGNESSPGNSYLYFGDVIHGGAGADTINGDDGNDYLYGDDGDDHLYGGDGNDMLDGGSGNDQLDGSNGDDSLYTYAGTDTLLGGAGNDSLTAFNGTAVRLDGGAGNDTLNGSDAATYIGGSGNDSFIISVASGAAIDTTAVGGDGDDTFTLNMNGTARSHMVLSGGAGVDTYLLRGIFNGSGAGPRIDVDDFAAGSGGDRIDVQPLLAADYGGNPFADATLKLTTSGSDTLLQLKTGSATGDDYLTVLRLAGVQPGQLTASNFVAGIDPAGAREAPPITGTDGPDTLYGSILDDTISGGKGYDYLYGGNGNDSLSGGADGDYLYGGNGNDVLDGGDGTDTLYGDAGNDTLSGGAGNDYLDVGGGDNSADGGAGDDTLSSYSTGTNLLEGGSGNDALSGGSGNDTLSGGDGDDRLTVNGFSVTRHDVTVSGGDGNDTIRFSAIGGADIKASGGGGADTFVFDSNALYNPNALHAVVIGDFSAAGGDRLDLRALIPAGLGGNPFGSAGILKAVQNGADTTIWYDADGPTGAGAALALVTLTGVGLDALPAAAFTDGYDPSGTSTGMTLNGGDGDDRLVGGALDDTIKGGAGRDTIDGSGGNDLLYGGDETGPGNGDIIHGGAGNDTIEGGAGADTLYGGAGDDTLDGGDGDDMLSDAEGSNVLLGGAGNDRLDARPNYTGSHDNRLDGGAGDDILIGGSANDVLSGGTGNDLIQVFGPSQENTKVTVDGGAGDDVIEVANQYGDSFGSIDASGGGGSDTFRIIGNYGTLPVLRIADFQAGANGDVFDLMRLLPYDIAANPFGSLGYLRVQQDGADTLLQFDRDGAVGSAAFATIAVLKGVAAGALTGANFTNGFRTDGSAVGLDLQGSGGSDTLTGGILDDTLHGGDGNDYLYGGKGADLLYGDAGNDVLHGDGGDDSLYGGAGDDVLDAGDGKGTLDGGDGDDYLYVYGGQHVLHGGAGQDTLSSNGAADTLDGGAGDDRISISAFTGGPSAAAGGNTAQADGGDGNDRISVALGSGAKLDVSIRGGAGSDSFLFPTLAQGNLITITDFQAGPGGDQLDLSWLAPWNGKNPFAAGGILRTEQRGADTVLLIDPDGNGAQGFQDLLTLKNVDKAALGAANFWNGINPDGSDTGLALTGGDGADTLTGKQLDDILSGGAGNDTLSGGIGNDTLYGGDGNDMLDGDAPDSYLSYGPNDRHDDHLVGGAGNDVLSSDVGSDTLEGGAGTDMLMVARGYGAPVSADETVVADGGDGDDLLIADFWSGTRTNVEFRGGAGSDMFSIAAKVLTATDTITIADFQAGPKGDLLDAFDVVSWHGVTPFSDGTYRMLQRGADTVLQARDARYGTGYYDVVTLKNVDMTKLTADNTMGFPPDGATTRVFDGTDGVDILTGGFLDDTLNGGAGSDVLDGGSGKDTLNGGAGNDLLLVTGNPYAPLDSEAVLRGGDGDDVFRVTRPTPDTSHVTATGGGGRDVFEAGGRYQVTDFQAGASGDLIKLAGFLVDAPQDPFGAGHLLRLVQSGSDAVLEYDRDGTGSASGYLPMLVLKNVNANAITAENIVEHIDPHPGAPAPTPTPVPPVAPVPAPAPLPPASAPPAGIVNTGSKGDDVLTGGGGNDLLIGGDGRDTASYGGRQADYTVTRDANGWHVADARGLDGTDTLQGIERVRFADGALALDLDGVAAQAYRFYSAVFDRKPDQAGLGYWISVMDDGLSLRQVANGFATSKEFADLYGSAPTNADVVTLLYENVLHRTPDQAGHAYWVDILDQKKLDLPGVLVAFSESAENQAITAGLIGNGIAFTPWQG